MSKLLVICAFLGLALASVAQTRKLTIAAASDLKYALDSVVSDYSKSHPETTVAVVYGSSGRFYEQISNGAPFDLFFSADVSYPQKLEASGRTGQPIRKYGRGRIVIWSRRFDPTVQKMESLLDKRINRIAIANPEHAPYGRRAVESMKKAKVYDRVASRLVYGENISQAAQFVTTGAADAGIVALSLALSPAMRNGKFFLIPEDLHEPLDQAVVILKRAAGNADARDFQEFVLDDHSKAIFTYFGFAEPE